MRIVRLWVVALLCVGWGQWGCYEYGPYNVPYVPCTVGDTASITYLDSAINMPVTIYAMESEFVYVESVLVAVNGNVWGYTTGQLAKISGFISTDSLPYNVQVDFQKTGYRHSLKSFWGCEKSGEDFAVMLERE